MHLINQQVLTTVGQYTNEPKRARDALFYIDAGCPREEWVKIGMSAKAAGLSFDDFDEWSATGKRYKNRQDCLTVWNSFDEFGSITPATLFGAAREQGWKDTCPLQPRKAPTYVPSNPVKKPSNPAPKTWAMCTPAPPDHPYIARKHGHPDGLRVYPIDAPPLIIKNQNVAGWLVIPAWSDSQLQTLQFVPPNGGEKLNLPGATFNDGYYAVGKITDKIHVVEGIGQAWAINAAKEACSIVTFGAGRMLKIAKLLRAKYPTAKLVIVPDRGKEADAAKIAAAVSGCYVEMPSNKTSNYDTNDYLIEHGADALATLLSKTLEPQPIDAFQKSQIDYSTMPNYEGTPSPNSLLIWEDGDNMADNATAPEYLINDILETDSHGVLAGASQAFKTFADLRMVYSICTGNDFFGHKVFTTGKVLYICGEGRGALKRRLKALKIVEGDFKGNLCVLDYPLRIDNPVDMAMLRQSIENINPVLVVFDTFASLVSATDENSPSEVGRALRLIKETCRHGKTSSLIIHHYGKDAAKGPRGASNFGNDVDFCFEMIRVPDSMLTTLSCKKMKDGEIFGDINMQAHVVNLGIIRQDGKMATSLVLKPTDHQPGTKGVNKRKPLKGNNEKIFSALLRVLETKGIQPTPDIKVRFGGFDSGKRVVRLSEWKVEAYRVLGESRAESTNRMAFERAQNALSEFAQNFDDYWWVV